MKKEKWAFNLIVRRHYLLHAEQENLCNRHFEKLCCFLRMKDSEVVFDVAIIHSRNNE